LDLNIIFLGLKILHEKIDKEERDLMDVALLYSSKGAQVVRKK
jgi:hypothetical protein